jgi:DHA2 family multidrug resistance protein
MWQHRAILHHAQLAEKITVYDPTSQAAIATLGQGSTVRGSFVIDQMITQQSYQISFNELFFMLGCVFGALTLIVWLAKPPFSSKAGPAAATAGGH